MHQICIPTFPFDSPTQSDTYASYCPVDILLIKLFTIKIFTYIPIHCFDKKQDRSTHWGRSQSTPTTCVGYPCY